MHGHPDGIQGCMVVRFLQLHLQRRGYSCTCAMQVLAMLRDQLDGKSAAMEKLTKDGRKLREQRDRAAALTSTLVKDNALLKEQVPPALHHRRKALVAWPSAANAGSRSCGHGKG